MHPTAHSGAIREIFCVHDDDINTCAPFQRAYTLQLSSGRRGRDRAKSVREREQDMRERDRERERVRERESERERE